MLERRGSRKHPWRQEKIWNKSTEHYENTKIKQTAPPFGRAAAVRLGHVSDTERMRTQPSGSGMTKTIWQAIVVFWNGVTRSARIHYARQPSYYRRIMPPADPLPPVVVQYQSVSQMRPKGMNNGNEGAEFGPTLQSVKGDIVKRSSLYKWGGTQMF